MNTLASQPQPAESLETDLALRQTIMTMIDEMISSLPDPKKLTHEQRRGIIARYSSVLEGNFIYWMTATLIATKSEDARPILIDNLYEEVRDSHPHMLRKFAMAAHAFPTDSDSLAVHESMTKVRLFLGNLSGVQSLLTMAFFEGYIQRFMPFLASLAAEEGSEEMEYTDVHGVCDIAHTDGLFNALSAEMIVNPLRENRDIFEGVNCLRAMLHEIVFYPTATAN